MVDASQIEKHMEVVGSDGQHVGAVDGVGIKLTKNDPAAGDQHHYLKLDMISAIEGGKVVLSIPAAEAHEMEKVVEN